MIICDDLSMMQEMCHFNRSREEIILDIIDFKETYGGDYDDWYVGTTDDPRKTFFRRYGLYGENGTRIYCPCPNRAVADRIRSYFLSKGMKSDTSCEEDLGLYVYTYKTGNGMRTGC